LVIPGGKNRLWLGHFWGRISRGPAGSQRSLPLSPGLRYIHEHPCGGIASVLGRLISIPGVEIGAAAMHLDALDRYRTTKAHFVDCLIAATAVAEKMAVASFDQDFQKFTDVRMEIE